MAKKQTKGGGDAAKGTTMFSKTVAKHNKMSGPYTPKGGSGGAKKNSGGGC